MMPREEIPGYREAMAREEFTRLAAFAPINESICGLDARPLTLQHVLFLSLADSPFGYANLDPERLLKINRRLLRGYVQQFFWIVSPNYRPQAFWSKLRLSWRVGRIPDELAIAAICDFINEAFTDAEGGRAGRSYYAFVVEIIGALCPKYGTDDELMQKPVKRLFQYFRYEARRAGQSLTNRSDQLRAQWRAERNTKLKLS